MSITIRKPSSVDFTLDDLEKRQFFEGTRTGDADAPIDDSELRSLYRNGQIKEFLRQAVVSRKNIIISGATGSAKTTLSKALIKHIPEDERIISLEDTPELIIPQPNHVRLFYSKDRQGLSHAGPKELLNPAFVCAPIASSCRSFVMEPPSTTFETSTLATLVRSPLCMPTPSPSHSNS